MQEDREIKEHNKDYGDSQQDSNQQKENTLAMLESLKQKLKHLSLMPSSIEQTPPNKSKKGSHKIK